MTILTQEMLDKMCHAIGLDNKKPFRRRGALIYIPYRNYYDLRNPDPDWEFLVKMGYASSVSNDSSITYYVEPKGIQWLAKCRAIKICLPV